jgi:hypothetical protein
MWRALQMFKNAHRQTKFFIFMWALYMVAIAWTTAQAYARLAYSRNDLAPPIVIRIPTPDQKSNGPS